MALSGARPISSEMRASAPGVNVIAAGRARILVSLFNASLQKPFVLSLSKGAGTALVQNALRLRALRSAQDERDSSYNHPHSSRASSPILEGSHGGSQTKLTTASRMPGTDSTRSSTSFGSDSATGQWGVVSVIVMVASPSSLISTL